MKHNLGPCHYQDIHEIIAELNPSPEVLQQWLAGKGMLVHITNAKAWAERIPFSAYDDKEKIQALMAEEQAGRAPASTRLERFVAFFRKLLSK